MSTSKTRSIVVCIAASVALFALAVTPALAGDDSNGNAYGHDKKESGDNFQEADQQASEPTSQEPTSEPTPSDGSTSRQSSSTTTSRQPSGGGNQEPDPDPTPSQAPASNKGPTACPTYSQNSGGAYDHDSCDTTQGQHGSTGNGKCAGCTGLADDKGPGGQHPGDHNNGYECDHNGGVGKGNPAHSRCPVQNPPPPFCPQGTDLAGLPPGSSGCDIPPNRNCPQGSDMAGLPPGPNGCNIPPNENCPPGSDMAGLPPGPNGCNEDEVQGRTDKVCPEGTDLVGADMTNIDDCVLGKVIQRGTPEPPAVLPAVLPFTGAGDLLPILLVGLLLIGLGVASLRVRKQA
jgi:hypothetical protein